MWKRKVSPGMRSSKRHVAERLDFEPSEFKGSSLVLNRVLRISDNFEMKVARNLRSLDLVCLIAFVWVGSKFRSLKEVFKSQGLHYVTATVLTIL
jgi:hypothetical protein